RSPSRSSPASTTCFFSSWKRRTRLRISTQRQRDTENYENLKQERRKPRRHEEHEDAKKTAARQAFLCGLAKRALWTARRLCAEGAREKRKATNTRLTGL